MLKENLWMVSLIGSLIASIVLVTSIGKASPEPVIRVEPTLNTVAPSQTFTINISIADVTLENTHGYGAVAWEVDISFNSTVLNVFSVKEGSWLKQAGSTWWIPPQIDNTTGTIIASASLFPIPVPPQTGATGSGTLANVTFKVMNEGRSDLHFYKSLLRAYNGTTYLVIEHTTVDGAFKYPLLRNVAVTSVSVSPTSVSIGEPVSINVTVKNEGEATETFDVTVFYDSVTIETKKATDLAPGNSQTLSFSWNTRDVAEDNYTITAKASTLSGETNTADNTYTNGAVTLKAPPTFPTELLAGAIIATVAVLIVIILYTRRRKPTKT